MPSLEPLLMYYNLYPGFLNFAGFWSRVNYLVYQQLSQTGAVSQLQISEKKAALQAAFASQKQAQAATIPSNVNVIEAQASIDREQARGKAKISALNLDRKTLVEKQISLSSQIKSDRYELQQLQNDLEQTIIRATASGIVQQLNLRNSG